MRSTTRHRRRTAPAALAAGLLLAGCGGDGGQQPVAGTAVERAGSAREVRLQPLAARGPDPFTASTARPSPPGAGAPGPAGPPPPGGGRTPRAVPGDTPGLYGGTRSRAGCDVEKQVRLLSRDRARAGAFAQAAGIRQADIASWLRGLTPVTLRADTRVTNHGYRDGAATAYQAVLQAGTAVLVDQYGAPRIRCACGNPLRSPAADRGEAVHKGSPWPGYHPGRVVVVDATQQVVPSLIIVDDADNTWIERKAGTDGERDKHPDVPPPYAPTRPGEPNGPASPGEGSADPGETGAEPPGASEPGAVSPEDCPTELPGPHVPGEAPSRSPVVPPGCPTPPPPPSPPLLPDGPEDPGPDAQDPGAGDPGGPLVAPDAPAVPETYEG
ncbi:DUF6777 domain-containing protein [Streptomyces sp. NPDC050856]|uniref:DUF6777 domain-containing protein n=1 Tax=Streptomyces sp. NPDC050856 TaxID=3154939 RepID=UPI0034062B7A